MNVKEVVGACLLKSFITRNSMRPYTLSNSILLVNNTAYGTMTLYWSLLQNAFWTCQNKRWAWCCLSVISVICASVFVVTHWDLSQITLVSGPQSQGMRRSRYHDESWGIFGAVNELLIVFSWSWPLLCLRSGASKILPLPEDWRFIV